ncbi:hypothetical protein DEU56DRAFT_755839 [Suillus clintonianus]|uniref:uncharacterized protein n=1 Tax=Suillus clintonianus TaxID=1904413 RepID=UPI001B86AEC2|nr:uncharacterized protein DEU56DRAFT_755839 [Suillus clintonianus]KAG2138551.1 hypothetical protein DEU56DRAFT_755839 [Suillus clintonianus]
MPPRTFASPKKKRPVKRKGSDAAKNVAKKSRAQETSVETSSMPLVSLDLAHAEAPGSRTDLQSQGPKKLFKDSSTTLHQCDKENVGPEEEMREQEIGWGEDSSGHSASHTYIYVDSRDWPLPRMDVEFNINLGMNSRLANPATTIPMDTETPLPLATISLAFKHLKNDVRRALNTQVGDVARLDKQIAMCINLERHIEYHTAIIPANDHHLMLLSIQDMIADLEVAKTASMDEPDIPPAVHTMMMHTGGHGHPHIEIDSDILATAYQLAGPAQLSEVFGVSARTI